MLKFGFLSMKLPFQSRQIVPSAKQGKVADKNDVENEVNNNNVVSATTSTSQNPCVDSRLRRFEMDLDIARLFVGDEVVDNGGDKENLVDEQTRRDRVSRSFIGVLEHSIKCTSQNCQYSGCPVFKACLLHVKNLRKHNISTPCKPTCPHCCASKKALMFIFKYQFLKAIRNCQDASPDAIKLCEHVKSCNLGEECTFSTQLASCVNAKIFISHESSCAEPTCSCSLLPKELRSNFPSSCEESRNIEESDEEMAARLMQKRSRNDLGLDSDGNITQNCPKMSRKT